MNGTRLQPYVGTPGEVEVTSNVIGLPDTWTPTFTGGMTMNTSLFWIYPTTSNYYVYWTPEYSELYSMEHFMEAWDGAVAWFDIKMDTAESYLRMEGGSPLQYKNDIVFTPDAITTTALIGSDTTTVTQTKDSYTVDSPEVDVHDTGYTWDIYGTTDGTSGELYLTATDLVRVGSIDGANTAYTDGTITSAGVASVSHTIAGTNTNSKWSANVVVSGTGASTIYLDATNFYIPAAATVVAAPLNAATTTLSALKVDTTNNRFWFYTNSAWRSPVMGVVGINDPNQISASGATSGITTLTITTSSGTPTFSSLGVGACSGGGVAPTVTITGNTANYRVTLTTGNGACSPNNDMVIITNSGNYRCALSPQPSAIGVTAYVFGETSPTTRQRLYTTSTLTVSTQYIWDVVCAFGK